MTYDVTFSYATPNADKSKTFSGISAKMFLHLREKYFAKYGDKMLAVDVYIHNTELYVDGMSWICDQDEEYSNPIAFYERYGW